MQDATHDTNGAARHHATLLPVDRFNAFSDGVLAIAITILVLELAVPSLAEGVVPALREMWPDLLGYFLSFTFIGGIWVSHARLTSLMKRGDSTVYGLNLLVLLFVALLPFTTKLMVTNLSSPHIATAVIIYGLNVLVASLTMSLLMFDVARKPGLLVDEVADDTLKGVYRQRAIVLGVAAVAVAVAFVAPHVAVALYVVVSLSFLVLPLLGSLLSRRSPVR
jgi:uncharacterized membrane protein